MILEKKPNCNQIDIFLILKAVLIKEINNSI